MSLQFYELGGKDPFGAPGHGILYGRFASNSGSPYPAWGLLAGVAKLT